MIAWLEQNLRAGVCEGATSRGHTVPPPPAAWRDTTVTQSVQLCSLNSRLNLLLVSRRHPGELCRGACQARRHRVVHTLRQTSLHVLHS